MLQIEAECQSNKSSFLLNGTAFCAMNWPLEKMGSDALVYPGQSLREQARCHSNAFDRESPSL